jgi:hypothetical protein
MIAEPCPFCGADGVPVVYGLPTHDAIVAAEDGKIRLGGCVVMDSDVKWQCTAHEAHEWTDGPRWHQAVNAILDEYENRPGTTV